MAYPVVYSTYEPPNYTETWYDLGNDLWTQDPLAKGNPNYVPDGYYIDLDTGKLARDYSQTDISSIAPQVEETKKVAKTNGDTNTIKIMDMILLYGSQIITVLAKNNVIKNVNAPLTYDNIGKEQLAAAFKNGSLSIGTGLEYNPPKTPTPPPTNSTFLGIDFSNGLNIALLLLGLFGLWKLISSGSEPKEQKEQNRGSQNFSSRPQRRSVNV